MGEAKARWALGAKGESIAKDLGLAPSTVRMWAKRNGWDGDRELARHVELTPGGIPTLAHDLMSESSVVRHKAARVTEHQLDVLMGVQPGKDLGKIHKRGQGIRDAVNAAAMVFGWASQDAVATFAATVKVARQQCRPPAIDVESQNETVEAVPAEGET